MILRRIIVALLVIGSAIYSAIGFEALATPAAAPEPSVLGAPIVSARRVPEVAAANMRDTQLRAGIKQLVSSAGERSCVDVERNEVDIASVREDMPLVPASTTKLLTAAAALEVLGEENTFETQVRAPSVKNGIVNGPLYLVGGGDPLLYTDEYARSLPPRPGIHTRLESLADAVVESGVKRVNGGVSADDRMFDGERSIPTWDAGYIAQAQVGSIGALTVNQGIDLRPARTVVPDPATYAATEFTQLLQARGIQVAFGPGLGLAPKDSEKVATVKSKPVREIVAEMLTESDNTTAEILLKHIGKKKADNGSTSAARPVVMEMLNTDATTMVDGSGLDRGNRTTCDTLTRLLGKDGPTGELATALARAGETGTLTGRMRNTPAVGRVQAKTGTLGGVSALSGWVHPEGGEPVSFAMIVNGRDSMQAQALEDQLAVVLATLPPIASTIAYAPDPMAAN